MMRLVRRAFTYGGGYWLFMGLVVLRADNNSGSVNDNIIDRDV